MNFAFRFLHLTVPVPHWHLWTCILISISIFRIHYASSSSSLCILIRIVICFQPPQTRHSLYRLSSCHVPLYHPSTCLIVVFLFWDGLHTHFCLFAFAFIVGASSSASEYYHLLICIMSITSMAYPFRCIFFMIYFDLYFGCIKQTNRWTTSCTYIHNTCDTNHDLHEHEYLNNSGV